MLPGGNAGEGGVRRWRRGMIAGLAVGAASCGAANAEPSVITNPDWVRRPTGQNVADAYPDRALRAGLSGRAIVTCSVTLEGALSDCAILNETPPGYGFGAAAMRLTRSFWVRPATRDGKPVAGGKVTLPISFSLPGGGNFVSGVSWPTAPSVAEVAAAFPDPARATGASGKAVVSCKFDKPGNLTRCGVASQEPRGLGFGEAALKLASRFTAAPTLADGHSVRGLTAFLSFSFTPAILEPAAGLLGKPRWTVLPSAEQFTAAFPEAAVKAGVNAARIVLACTIQPDGSLGGCAVDSETPPNLGFGPAALGLSSSFRAQLWSDEGLPVIGGAIRLPIRFQIEAAPAAGKPPSTEP